MLYPSVQDMTNDSVNRYMLVIAAAKGARYLTYKQNKERDLYEVGKESEGQPEETGEKAVSLAVDRLYDGRFKIVKD